MNHGILEYLFEVPHDLRGGPDQRIVITTRAESGSLHVVSIALRAGEPSTGTVHVLGAGKIIDGRLVLCSEQPELCAAPSPTPAAELDPVPEQAPPAAAPPAETPIDSSTPPPVPQPPANAPAAEPTTSPTAMATSGSTPPQAPPWVWVTLFTLAGAGTVAVIVVRVVRERDHAARLRRMAEHD